MTQSPEDLPTFNEPSEQALPLNQEQYWQAHIDCWAQSGLSQSAYCQREGLILHRWHYWHKKLTRSEAVKPKPASDFIPVKVMTRPQEQSLKISLPNGITIVGVNAQTLPLLGAVLKQL